MSDRKKYFDDADGIINNQRGIFGADCAGLCGDSAMDAFSQLEVEPSKCGPDGMTFRATCEGCGMRGIQVGWPEFIAAKNNISPHFVFQNAPQWGTDSETKRLRPDLRCRCNWQIAVSFSPGEISAFIDNAIRSGWISEQIVRQLTQAVLTRKQQIISGQG